MAPLLKNPAATTMTLVPSLLSKAVKGGERREGDNTKFYEYKNIKYKYIFYVNKKERRNISR